MQRRQGGWYLTLIATGPPPVHPDELLQSVRRLRDLRGTPLRRDGWRRRDYGFELDRGHDGVPIHVIVLAYAIESAPIPFVPNVSAADGVLLFRSGSPAVDRATEDGLRQALRKRLGGPPEIIEIVPASDGDVAGATEHMRGLVRAAIDALREGSLPDFWALAAEQAAAKVDDAVFGPLTQERIREQPAGTLVRHLLNIAYERACRAVREGRIQYHEEYDRRRNAEWNELFVLNAVEAQTADAGLASLFGSLEPEAIARAIRGYERLGASTKASALKAALAIDGARSTARTELDLLTARFDDAADEDIHRRLEDEIRRAPTPFELPSFEAEW